LLPKTNNEKKKKKKQQKSKKKAKKKKMPSISAGHRVITVAVTLGRYSGVTLLC